ncbi:MAG: hypothetical protein ACRC5H_02410 [Treponemataceae bacterium]
MNAINQSTIESFFLPQNTFLKKRNLFSTSACFITENLELAIDEPIIEHDDGIFTINKNLSLNNISQDDDLKKLINSLL